MAMAGEPPITRRLALAHAMRLAGGVLIAGGLGQIRPAGAIEAQVVSGPLGTAPSPLAPMPLPIPASPSELRVVILANRLRIASVGLDEPGALATSQRPAGGGRSEIVVPNHGVVTANRVMGRNSANNIWVMGHSRWAGVPQALFALGGVRLGDRVSIEGYDSTRQRELAGLEFEVARLVLTDIDGATKAIYGERPKFPRLIVQTSVRQTGSEPWILSREVLEPKATKSLDGSIDDPSKYLLLLVIAELTAESRAVLIRPESG